MKIQEFNYDVDLLESLLWQYNNAPNLQSLLTQKQDWYNVNQTNFWNDWYNNVFNLQTANRFGCSVWSLILCLPLHIGDENIDKPVWGFDPKNNGYVNFDNGNFSDVDDEYNISLEEQRLLLKLRYFQLTSRAAIPEINRFLKFAFDELDGYTGQVYVLDSLKMSIRVISTGDLNPKLVNLIEKYDLIPRGAGVGIEYWLNIENVFGFDPFDNGFVNFDNGGFIPDNLAVY